MELSENDKEWVKNIIYKMKAKNITSFQSIITRKYITYTRNIIEERQKEIHATLGSYSDCILCKEAIGEGISPFLACCCTVPKNNGWGVHSMAKFEGDEK